MRGVAMRDGLGASGLPEPLLSFTIPGRPVPWARSRAYVQEGGGKAGMGSVGFAKGKPQRAYSKTLAQYAGVAAIQARIRKPLDGALWLTVRIFLNVPASWQKADPVKWAEAMAGGFCIERPDLDNWVKLPMDALNGLAWHDDAQIVGFPESGKWYDEANPRLECAVRRAG